MSLPKEEMRRASTTLRHTGLLGAHPTSWDQSWTRGRCCMPWQPPERCLPQADLGSNSASPPSYCVTVGKWLSLAEPQCP